jgi:hypothetical protein
MSNITLPTVHLNGTSRDSLLDDYMAAMDAIRLAMKALQSAAPHPRDYYVQSNMSAHLARDEHFTRLARLRETLDELNTIAEHVAGVTP